MFLSNNTQSTHIDQEEFGKYENLLQHIDKNVGFYHLNS